MTEDEMRRHRCCFTGHREHKLHRSEDEIRKDLEEAILLAIKGGFTTFITGMATGVDIWAGEIVLELKRQYPELKLIAAVPFEGFEKSWDSDWQNRYHILLERADLVQYICTHYANYAFQKRNEWMVNHSSRVIAVFTGEAGGTRNTIQYAMKKAVPVELLAG